MPEENPVPVPTPIVTQPITQIDPKKSSRNKWLIAVGIGFLVLIVLVGYIAYKVIFPLPEATTLQQTAKATYDTSDWTQIKKESEDIGIELKIPKDWGVLGVNPPYGVNSLYIIPKNDTSKWSNGVEYITNTFESNKSCCEVVFYLEDNYQAHLEHLESGTGVTNDTSYKDANGGIKFIDTGYSKTKMYFYVYNKSGKALTLSYTPLPNQSDNYLETIERIISTIKFL